MAGDRAVDYGHADAGQVAELDGFKDGFAGCVLGLIHQNEVSAEAFFNHAGVQVALTGGVAGAKAERQFGGHVAEAGEHGDHAQDAQGLHARACGGIGAKDDAVDT